MDNKRKTTVSIAMCVHNEEKDLPDCLESLMKQTFKPLEVIIVDDGSTDGTLRVINEYIDLLPIRLIKVKRMTLRPARKMCVEKATGDIVITIDGDMVLDKNSINNIAEKFIDNKVAAVGGNIQLYGKGTIIDSYQILNNYFKLLRSTTNNEIDWIGGGCAAYHRNILESLGGLREDNIGEDVEISWRLKKHGWKVIQAEDAIIYHKYPEGIKDIFKTNIKVGRRSVKAFSEYNEKLISLKFWLRFYPIALIPLIIFYPYITILFFISSFFIFYLIMGKLSNSLKIRTYAFIILLITNIGWSIGLFSELIIQIIRKTELVLGKPWK